MANKHLVLSTTLKRSTDIASLNQRFINRFYFRGQANSEWELESSLRRMVSNHNPGYIDWSRPRSYEREMLDEFRWKYQLYASGTIPAQDDYPEWLSLMQHYGAPTRLLDFTHSLFIALYMALDDSFFDSSAIWAINKSKISGKTFETYRERVEKKSSFGYDESAEYSKQLAREFISKGYHRDQCLKQVVAITPSICNERISKQQGIFLMPTNIAVPFTENLTETLECPIEFEETAIENLIDYSHTREGKHSQNDIILFKINIPFRLKLELTRLLDQMNLTAETIYSGLTGLAKSLSRLRFGDLEYDD